MKRLAWIFLLTWAATTVAGQVQIGSKRFTESYVLGEVARMLLEEQEIAAQHRQGMGGTIVLWEALRGGSIDAYPDYTGTIAEEILKLDTATSLEGLREALKPHGIGLTRELGFNNTYALVMRRKQAEELNISSIRDLREHSHLRVGITHEFLGRQDGWQPMARHYSLDMHDIRAIDHALGYAALAAGSIDVKDAYSTDARISELDLVVLEDDGTFFPEYQAVFLFRLDLPEPALAALRQLEGSLDEGKMIRLNAEAERTNNYSAAAALFFGEEVRDALVMESPWRQILRWTRQHLFLVGFSMTFAVLIGIPLGIIASRPGALSQLILGTTGVVQTIPSLALLAVLVPVPFLGISPATAILALFLYSLLPIVRNTASGLQDIPVSLRESAAALGLEPGAQLRKVFLPIASRSILGGIKTSAVINVGTATLAALIGAGGLGEPIISGLNLNDHRTILLGAVPAALLALLVQGAFVLIDRILISPGLSRGDHTSS
jgi:osmoprotectant transport system permease protein